MQYLPRIVDSELVERLAATGAVVVEGPKTCGKTATARNVAASEVLIDVDDNARRMVAVDPPSVLRGETPRLIDEWQTEPAIWNHIRRAVDDRAAPGQFILTGSAVPADDITRHTGARTPYPSAHASDVALRIEALVGRGLAAATALRGPAALGTVWSHSRETGRDRVRRGLAWALGSSSAAAHADEPRLPERDPAGRRFPSQRSETGSCQGGAPSTVSRTECGHARRDLDTGEGCSRWWYDDENRHRGRVPRSPGTAHDC